MKKLTLSIIIILLVSVAATPWITGLYLKREQTNLIAQLNLDPHIQITINHYHVGWLSSNSNLSLRIILPNMNTPIDAIVDETIQHGPIIYSKQRPFIALALIHSTVQQSLTPNPAYIDTIATFKHELRNWIHVKASSTTLPNNGKLVWQGLTGRATANYQNHQLTNWRLQLILGPLNATLTHTEPQQISIQPITITYDGKYTIHSPGASITTPSNNNASIENFSFSSNEIIAPNFDLNDLSLAALNNIKNTSVDMNIKIAIPYANKLIATYIKTPSPAPKPAAPVTKTPLNMYNEKIAELMKEGKITLPIAIDVMALHKQNLDAKQLSATLDQLKVPTKAKTEIITLYLQYRVNQTAPVIATNPTNTIASDWQKAGYLIQENNYYLIHVQYDNHVLKINNKPIEEGKPTISASN